MQQRRVLVTIRPRYSENLTKSIEFNENEKTVRMAERNGEQKTTFTYDSVLLPTTSQENVYKVTAKTIVESVLEGYNGTIIAYGQTGAGKTYTMTGEINNYTNRGICPRVVPHLFGCIKEDSEYSTKIRVSYMEIYNEQLYDLLDFEAPERQKKLTAMENSEGETFIRGLKKIIVDNEESALELFFQGQTNRTIAEHSLNDASTRSHCIFTLYLEKLMLNDKTKPMISSKLHLVDLAGSERANKTNTSGSTFKEATFINKSLTFLEQVVIALTDKSRQHIPYRQTVLTNILKDSLGGNSATHLLACIWPDAVHDDQTISTLRFASRMMRVQATPVINTAKDMSVQAQKYLAENIMLKKELALHDLISGRSCIDYNPITTEQHEKLANAVKQFIHDSNAVLPITTYQSIQEIFSIFRTMVLERKITEVQHIPQVAQETTEILNQTTTSSSREIKDEQSIKNKEMKITGDKEEAFAKYKETEGKDLLLAYEKSKENVKHIKKKVKLAAAIVNTVKSELDSLIKASEKRDQGSELPDQSNEETLTAIKSTKKRYRTSFQEFEEVKNELQYLIHAKDQCLNNLIQGFEYSLGKQQ